MRSITAEELATVLQLHRRWLAGEPGGRCLNLSGADLRRAPTWVGAYLSGADLRGAYLSGACGIVWLDMVDPREYQPVAVAHAGGWRITSGCRYSLTIAEALEHWGDGYEGDREIGDRYLRAIKALPECPTVESEDP